MKLEVRLFANLRQGRGKKITMEIEAGMTPLQVMEKLHIKSEEVSILLVNGLSAERDKQLNDGDIMSLFPPVGGG